MPAAKVQIKIEKCIYLGEIFPIQTIQNLFFPKGIFFKYTKVNNKKEGVPESCVLIHPLFYINRKIQLLKIIHIYDGTPGGKLRQPMPSAHR